MATQGTSKMTPKAAWMAALVLTGALLIPTSASAFPGVLIRLAPARAVVLVKTPKPKPVRVIRPVRKVWVKGHWEINLFGRRVWVAGHWKRLP